jgi:hypothetical protein
MRTPTKALTLVAVVASLGVGCADNDGGKDRSRDKDRDGIPNSADPRPNRPDRAADDLYRDRDGAGDRVGGGVRGIPRDAIRLEKDEGPEMRVRPNRDGRIFLYDPRAERVEYEGRLLAKEEFVVNPGRDSITIDGKRVDRVQLRPNVRYELYFLRD